MNLTYFLCFLITCIVLLAIFNFQKQEMNTLSYVVIGLITYLSLTTVLDTIDNDNDTKQNMNQKNNNAVETTTTNMRLKKIPTTTQKTNDIIEEDKTGPFDGLPPTEMKQRLNYLYYATSHPKGKVSYLDYKTHSDKLLEKQKTSLASEDNEMLNETRAFYPDLTNNQVNARDCLQQGYNNESCYQHPKLFKNLKKTNKNSKKLNNTNNSNNVKKILTDGINENNVNHIIKEDFSSPSLVCDKNPFKSIMINAPGNPNEKQYDISNLLCRGCTVGVCEDNYCGHQNELFL